MCLWLAATAQVREKHLIFNYLKYSWYDHPWKMNRMLATVKSGASLGSEVWCGEASFRPGGPAPLAGWVFQTVNACQLPFCFPQANSYKYSHISHILYLCFRKCLRCIRNGGDIIIIFQNWPNFVKYKITDGTTQYWCGALRLNHNLGLKMFPFGTGWWWECMCRELAGGVVPLLCPLSAFLFRESRVKKLYISSSLSLI